MSKSEFFNEDDVLTGDWWVEYLEGELENQNHLESMDLLLRHSKGDEQILDQLKVTKKLVADTDGATDFEEWFSDSEYQNNLTHKIMESVMKADKEKTIWNNLKESKGWRWLQDHLSWSSIKNNGTITKWML